VKDSSSSSNHLLQTPDSRLQTPEEERGEERRGEERRGGNKIT